MDGIFGCIMCKSWGIQNPCNASAHTHAKCLDKPKRVTAKFIKNYWPTIREPPTCLRVVQCASSQPARSLFPIRPIRFAWHSPNASGHETARIVRAPTSDNQLCAINIVVNFAPAINSNCPSEPRRTGKWLTERRASEEDTFCSHCVCNFAHFGVAAGRRSIQHSFFFFSIHARTAQVQ